MFYPFSGFLLSDALRRAVFLVLFFFSSHPSQLNSQQLPRKALWIPRRTNMGRANSTEAGRELPVRGTKL